MMRTTLLVSLGLAVTAISHANEVMTPEKLWQLKRVSPLGLNKDETHVIYKVTTPSVENNDFSSKVYQVSLNGGEPRLLEAYQGLLIDKSISADGSKKLFHEKVQIEDILASARHKELDKANEKIDSLEKRVAELEKL